MTVENTKKAEVIADDAAKEKVEEKPSELVSVFCFVFHVPAVHYDFVKSSFHLTDGLPILLQ